MDHDLEGSRPFTEAVIMIKFEIMTQYIYIYKQFLKALPVFSVKVIIHYKFVYLQETNELLKKKY